MRYIRYLFTILLALLLLTNGGIKASAMNTGFSTEALPKDDINTFLKNVKLSVLANEPQRNAIDCFDVNEDGSIAIGCSSFDNKTVCIYTSDGNFQYGYSFECSGSFGIEMDKNNLIIYFVRSDIAIAVNPIGEVVNILKIQNTSENNSYWNDSVFATKRKVGNTEYTLKNSMGVFNLFASSYSQLITTKVTGEVSIIYDVSSIQLTNILSVYISILILSCLVLFAVIRGRKTRKTD